MLRRTARAKATPAAACGPDAPASQWDARDRGLDGGAEPGGNRVNGAHEPIRMPRRTGLREGDACRSRRGHAPGTNGTRATVA